MVEIEEFFKRYKSAVYGKDVEALAHLYAAEVCVYDLWGEWSIVGVDAWTSMIREWFGSLGTEHVVVDFSDTHMSQADSLAFATAFVIYKAVSIDDKEIRSLQNRLTWVLEKRNDGWKIIHEHTSAPVNPETGKAIFKK